MYTLITRTGCHLCEQAENSLAALESELGISWQSQDIDSDRALAQFSDDLPVLMKDGKVLAKLTSSKAALANVLKPTMWQRLRNSLRIN